MDIVAQSITGVCIKDVYNKKPPEMSGFLLLSLVWTHSS